ncbi:MAG TPA: thiamine pyrophosphate-dependent enzyme [Magnetovibrio sp.]
MTETLREQTGGQIIAAALVAQGVDTAFCVPGESYLEVLDGLYDARDCVRLVTCRHENGAAFMAEAYAKLTGRVGVALVTRGPGACNASIGVHTAFQDSTPMVMLVGHVRRCDIGREAFQEVDFEAMFGPLAKAVRLIENADQAADAVHWAFETATGGRPGPVVLVLPEDVLREKALEDARVVIENAPESIDSGCMERLHHRLLGAERPLMMVGGSGWTPEARADIEAFAEANDLPVCTSFRRMDIFDNSHPCFVGEMGIAPNPQLVERFKAADLLIVVGARLGEMTTQGYTLLSEADSGHKLVHVYPEASELGRVFPTAVSVHSTVEMFAACAKALVPASGRWAEWRAQAHADYHAWKRPGAVAGPLDLGACMTWLDGALEADAVVTCDAGNFSGWAQRHLTYGGGRRYLGPTNGAMGYGVPAGIAAKAARADAQVVTFVGDGGFGMTGQEIATAVAEGLNPVILVFNNGIFGTIRMHQEKRFPERVIGTQLANPDYAALARAHGAFGETVESTAQFKPAFESALASGKVAVIEMRYDPEIITTRTTLSQIRAAAKSSEQP